MVAPAPITASTSASGGKARSRCEMTSTGRANRRDCRIGVVKPAGSLGLVGSTHVIEDLTSSSSVWNPWANPFGMQGPTGYELSSSTPTHDPGRRIRTQIDCNVEDRARVQRTSLLSHNGAACQCIPRSVPADVERDVALLTGRVDAVRRQFSWQWSAPESRVRPRDDRRRRYQSFECGRRELHSPEPIVSLAP